LNSTGGGLSESGPFQWKNKLYGKEINLPLINVAIALIVIGVLLWLVNRYIPMDHKIKSILNAVVVIAVVLWLLSVFGLFDSIANIPIGR
jgi:hypothetical protein